MRSFFVLFAPLLLTACASSTEVYTPTGERGYSLNCSGTARSWGMCYEKAGEICGRQGYTVLSKDGGRSTVITGDANGFSSSPRIGRYLLIQCKRPTPY